MPFQVTVHGFQQAPRTQALKTGANVLGRAQRADVVLAGPLVSRTHAKLVVDTEGKAVTLHDLDSNNGTFVNGEKIRSKPLNAGDTVFLGGFKLVLEASEVRAETAMDESLRQLPISDVTLGALDAARRGEPAAFKGKDPAARQLALLARTADLLGGRHGVNVVEELLRLIKEATDASQVALLTSPPGGVLALTKLLGEHPGEPPLSWPVIKRAADERSAFFSRERAVEPLLVDARGFDGPLAMLVVPLLRDHEGGALGVVQVLRPFANGGFADGEVDAAVMLTHEMAHKLSAPVLEESTKDGTEEPVEGVTETQRPAQAVPQGGINRDDLRAALLKAVPEELADRVMAAAQGQEVEPLLNRGEQVVVFYDLHGFDAFAARENPDVVAHVVGAVAAAAAGVASAFGGRLDQPMGSGGFLRFWDGSIEEACEAALRATLELRARMPAVLAAHGAALRLRAGADAGAVLAGVFAEGARATYTLVGSPIRVAERIAEMANAGEVFVTSPVRQGLMQRAGWRLIALGPHAIRGRSEAVDLFRVDGAPAGSA